ncbi:hypothetical protein BABA_21496 [Neobacillus bataviensis LMG 21833]|uniref:Uncharacterized protein n=1 Tax=Neobacillus bataviensis LMG 21833 TaxID=1117379 RepID=K6CYF5_9BACI|nr:hypothetical protein [Neobacillus bataviensis]EKN65262.1 hypothetical protein BABA_21496 [Neobacillus bataviensis LMG 21833]
MKQLRERLKPLSTKGKIEYLIQYYSFHFIVAIVIIVFLAMGIHTFTNQQKEILGVRVVGANVTDSQANDVQKELEKLLLDSKQSQNEKLSVISYNTSDVADNPVSVERIQKLAAEIAAKEVDVLLVDEETFHQFNQDGTNLYDLSSIKDFKDWNGPKYSPEQDTSKITGVDVSNVPIFTSLTGSPKPLILAVVTNTERLDVVKELSHFLK